MKPRIMQKTIRKILKLPLTLPLRMPFLRRRAAFHFVHDYFSDLEISLPLSHDFWCPIPTRDAVHSFSEIFVTNEYGSFLDRIPLPCRWLDLGAHTGYFTLYLAWQHAVRRSGKDWRALLIDADPRMEPLCKRTLEQNHLLGRCEFRTGLIAGGDGEKEFALREGMGSSADLASDGVQTVECIRVLRPAEILEALPPPYDLVKIDIEGAEIDFLEAYKEVCSHASSILLEWHSPDKEGTRAETLDRLLDAVGFRKDADLRPMRVLQLGGGWLSCGVQLYRRNGAE